MNNCFKYIQRFYNTQHLITVKSCASLYCRYKEDTKIKPARIGAVYFNTCLRQTSPSPYLLIDSFLFCLIYTGTLAVTLKILVKHFICPFLRFLPIPSLMYSDVLLISRPLPSPNSKGSDLKIMLMYSITIYSTPECRYTNILL